MSRYAVSVATAILFACSCPVLGQAISFDVQRPLPGQFGFDELWNITLHNPTTDTWVVYLHAEASAASAGPVFVANSQELKLAPGNQKLTARDVKLSDVWCEKGLGAFAVPGKTLPEGSYTYDITLVPQMAHFTVNLQVVAPRPLDLVWPPSGANVTDSLPVFVWTRPVVPRYGGEFLYSVRVAEMRPGQSCTTATDGNANIAEHYWSPATAWRYLDSAPKLVPGRKYAWRVEACDTGKVSVGTNGPMMKAGYFVYSLDSGQVKRRDTVEYPLPGQSLQGRMSVVVRTDSPSAEMCVLEYSLGSDSTAGPWQMVGLLTRTQDRFIGTWASDSALTRAQMPYGTPCALRATVLAAKGDHSELTVKTVINEPPKRVTRGCGCGH